MITVEPSVPHPKNVSYSGAVTLKPGPVARRVQNAVTIYGGLPNENILKGFRQKAGLPTSGEGLAGWAKETSEVTFGQWVSGLARLSAVLGDSELRAKAAELVDGYAATLPDPPRTGMMIYGWEKLVCGLVDAATFASYTPALDLLCKVVRADSFDLTRRLPVPNDFAGAGPAFTPEWYTLPENLYRGFLATGDQALAEFARLWHYEQYWERFLAPSGPPATWDIPVWLHAYSHVNTLSSLASAFEVYDDPKYLSMLRNAHHWLRETQCYATGGYGPSELMVPADGTLGRALEWRSDTAEIVCGTWAVFKLCTALFQATGEARYLEWPEALFYNGIGAVSPVSPDGRSPYYANYRLGWATKEEYWEQWPCCSGSYVQAVAHMSSFIYQQVEDGLAVGLFVPSQVTWSLDGVTAKLEQDTGFPASDETVLRLTMDQPQRYALWLRLPAWARRVDVRLNDELLRTEQSSACDQWLTIRREWSSGDRVALQFHPKVHALSVDQKHPDRVAIAYGPIVLAQDAAWSAPFSAPTPWPMVEWEELLTRHDGELRFSPAARGTARMPTGDFRPLSDIADHHPYRVYHDLAAPRII